MANSVVWLVGKNKSDNNWEVQGIFTDSDKARKACKTRYDFFGPIPLNEELPQETIEWPGLEYPVQE